ncbi:Cell surface glycan-binding lipoprotein, utilization system for glycans and polysaccharides (PUL), SusD family, partial [hydrothermal vent metagenome]
MFFCGALFLTSCETTELDLTENPNALTPTQANPDFFMNAIQEDFARFVETFGRRGAELTRIDYMNGRDYTNAYSPTDFNTAWRSAYTGMMQDIKVMNGIATESNLTHHIGMGQVFQAYIMLTLVDFFGDVPYTEALLGSENLNPIADSGESIYAAALGLLDAAIVNFGSEAAADPQYDFFYDGNWSQWIKAANTLKMKAYMATRLVDGSAISNFNAIVSSGNYISNKADDFQFTWGTNEIQPDTRHPRYSGSYTPTGGSDYMSNSLMDYMTGKDDAAYSNPVNFDIRTLFYFYRQVSQTPGIGGAPADEETLECGLYTAPTHYAGYTYCGVPKGWWG